MHDIFDFVHKSYRRAGYGVYGGYMSYILCVTCISNIRKVFSRSFEKYFKKM